MKCLIDLSTFVNISGLGILNALSLTAATVFIVLACNHGEHIEQHPVHSVDHAFGKVVLTLGRLQSGMAGSQVERHYCDLLGCDDAFQACPVIG
ncbi:hypothetical protein D3C79_1015060 [compost metagenome]